MFHALVGGTIVEKYMHLLCCKYVVLQSAKSKSYVLYIYQ